MIETVITWLKSIGYHGEARGSSAGIYPDDVERLCTALQIDAEKLSEMSYAKGKEEGWAARKAAEYHKMYGDRDVPPDDTRILKAEMRAMQFCMNVLQGGATRGHAIMIMEQRYRSMETMLVEKL